MSLLDRLRGRREGTSPYPWAVLDGVPAHLLLAPGVAEDGLDAHVEPPPGTMTAGPIDSGTRLPDDALPVLVALDPADLRQAVTGLPDLGSRDRVAVLLLAAEQPVVPRTRPDWPALRELTAKPGTPETLGALTLVRYAGPVPVRDVLLETARRPGTLPAWPTLGGDDTVAARPPADRQYVAADRPPTYRPDLELPPDVVLHDQPEAGPAEVHPVLGRAARVRAPGLGPVDDAVFNPRGFRRVAAGPPVSLEWTQTGMRIGELQFGSRLTADDLVRLQPVPGVRLDWSAAATIQEQHRLAAVLARLACSGVPLTAAAEPPDLVRGLLGEDVVTAIRCPVDLTDLLAREEHSLAVRRHALARHGRRGWRRGLATGSDVQQPPAPSVSVLLPTRRPEMTPFAVRQVARQARDVVPFEVELVLALHGVDPDHPGVATALGIAAEAGLRVRVLDCSAEARFGAVLNEAVAAAEGDILVKMDDDDWYGRYFLADLLLARDHSGAEVVGCQPEFTFVEPLWVTTRRRDVSEAYKSPVAGGTLCLDAGTVRALGGFRETTKYVDAGLLAAVLADGGLVYRTHGLGYVLRRGGSGHTWDPGLGYFVSRDRAWFQWRGFRPSAVLDADPIDVPKEPA